MDKNVEAKITELQTIEQSLQRFLAQKQQFQSQLVEIESALKELPENGESYKIIGNLMVAVESEKLKKDLESKKELLELKLKSVEKQEQKLREDADHLQKEVLESMKKEK